MDDSSAERLKGVRGWLLVFCILLLLNSLVGLASALIGLVHSFQLLADYGPEALLPVLEGLLNASIFCLGLYAAISLWRVRPKAVTLAFAFLVINLVFSIVQWGLAELYGESTSAIRRGVFSAVGFAAFWGFYLTMSKRVRATYGSQRPDDPQWDRDAKQYCPNCNQQFIEKATICPECRIELERIDSGG